MSVLIKGMKMPNACYECEFYNEVCPFDGVGVWYDPLRERADGCPLLEVPDHGDLIDRDELIENSGMCVSDFGTPDEQWRPDRDWYLTINAQTIIIPAERSEE